MSEKSKPLEIFKEIAQIPRKSKHEEQISQWLYEYGLKKTGDAYKDDHGNVIIKKVASGPFESSEPLMLQAHMDMVCVAEEGFDYDFINNGIELYEEGDWLKAKGTTLGADNGFGMATALALLDEPSDGHPPLEMLFTVDEEDGMTGAKTFDPSLIASQRCINLDGHEEGVVTIGHGGGCVYYIELPFEKIEATSKYFTKITLQGLLGGHSAGVIDRGHDNAIKMLARMVKATGEVLEIADFRGGTALNVIPDNASVVVGTNDLKSFKFKVEERFESIRSLGGPLSEIQISFEEVTSVDKVIPSDDTEKLLQALVLLPHGVSRKNPENGDLLCSNNISQIDVKEDHILIQSLARTTEDEDVASVKEIIETVAELVGADASVKASRDAWRPKADSKLREVYEAVYEQENGQPCSVVVTHAGLECGYINQRMSGIDIISISSDIEDLHSPSERGRLSSLERTYDLVKKMLKELK